MPSRQTILLLASLPVGAVVYTVTAQVIATAVPDQAILTLLVPLFVAGLAMLPFLIPFFDRKAQEDLAAYRRQQGAVGSDEDDRTTAAERRETRETDR
jgi:hypothetical protein